MILNRELDPILRYVNDRLTRRPIHAYLWAIWAWAFQAFLLWKLGKMESASAPAKALGLSIMAAAVALFFLVRLITLLCSELDREWLFTEMPYRNPEPVSSGSRIFVRIIPVIGLIAVVQYLFVL